MGKWRHSHCSSVLFDPGHLWIAPQEDCVKAVSKIIQDEIFLKMRAATRRHIAMVYRQSVPSLTEVSPLKPKVWHYLSNYSVSRIAALEIQIFNHLSFVEETLLKEFLHSTLTSSSVLKWNAGPGDGVRVGSVLRVPSETSVIYLCCAAVRHWFSSGDTS